MDCSGNREAGPEGIEMVRDGGTYVEMGQFTNAGIIDTNWHRICTKELQVLGSWALTPEDIAQAMANLYAVQASYDWSQMQRPCPLTERGGADAIHSATTMACVKATVIPEPRD